MDWPVKNSDLKSLSVDELMALQKDVALAIKDADAKRRKDAMAAVERAAANHGFTLKELLSDKKDTKSKPNAKYRHPENLELTWSGRGRKPKWFVEVLDAGHTPDSLEVG